MYSHVLDIPVISTRVHSLLIDYFNYLDYYLIIPVILYSGCTLLCTTGAVYGVVYIGIVD